MSNLNDSDLNDENSAALHVRALCQHYSGSAESVGSGRLADDEEISAYDRQQYERGRTEVLEIAIQLKEEFYRDTALHAALDYCMKAKDFEYAVAIAKAITVNLIQAAILDEHSEYFVLNDSDGRLHPTAAVPNRLTESS
jgi:hypothetical protein